MQPGAFSKERGEKTQLNKLCVVVKCLSCELKGFSCDGIGCQFLPFSKKEQFDILGNTFICFFSEDRYHSYVCQLNMKLSIKSRKIYLESTLWRQRQDSRDILLP